MQLPKVTKFTLKDDDKELFSEELIVLNAFVSQAQKGLDVSDPSSAEIWTSRLSSIFKDRYALELSPTICFLISVEVSDRMRELEANFTKGL
jgi:hypothetical protein